MDSLWAAKSLWDCASPSCVFYFNSCSLSAPWDAKDAAFTLQLKGCGALLQGEDVKSSGQSTVP